MIRMLAGDSACSRGLDNVMDGPSRGLGNIRLPDALEMPVHEMGWTKLGAVELCGRTRRVIWEAGRHSGCRVRGERPWRHR